MKLILNLVLIPIPEVGVKGAAWASVACHIVAFIIAITSLIKHLKIRFNIIKFIIKPVIATTIMAFCSLFIYNTINGIIPARLATIIAILFAIVMYIVAIVCLKIFSKKEILTLPMGEKICKVLEKTKIY